MPHACMSAAQTRLDELLAQAARRLAGTLGLEGREARLEAQVLAARALGVGRTWIVAHGRDALPREGVEAIAGLIERRAAGEPVAYILGEREFHGRVFRVTPDVLIPRPETELLVEAALERLPAGRPARVLDLCTGSGCIAISLALARPDLAVSAADLSEAALRVSRGNAATLGAKVEWHRGDLFAAYEGRRFDLIVSNPPYVAETDPHLERGDLRFEPRLALVAGADGLAVIQRLIDAAPGHLEADGWLLFEHGWDQAVPVLARMCARGYRDVVQLPDLQGHLRVTAGRCPAA